MPHRGVNRLMPHRDVNRLMPHPVHKEVFVANEDYYYYYYYYYFTVSCHTPLLPGTSTLETMTIPTARA